MKRVVVTGMAGMSPIGLNREEMLESLHAGISGIRYMPEWEQYKDLNTKLGGPVTGFSTPAHYSRKQIRSMGRVALMATVATEQALQEAGLLGSELLSVGRMGIGYGSSTGSPSAVADFGHMLLSHDSNGINANSYIKMMSHTAAVNIGVFFGIRGRIIPTSTACTSGSQGVGYAYEAVKYGMQDLMVAGGSEELCATEAAVFDALYATSTANQQPDSTPRPFDVQRDGLVIGEGACSLILEEYDHALKRGATILAEIVGFGTNSDGQHVTQPDSRMMEQAMRNALADARLNSDQIGYISAHGTATERGDIAETNATMQVFGSKIPISAFKSFTGHTLGACGALEAMISIEMMNRDWFHPTLNLERVDELCGKLDYIQAQGKEIQADYVMSNNFAFGGINTSIIFKRFNRP